MITTSCPIIDSSVAPPVNVTFPPVAFAVMFSQSISESPLAPFTPSLTVPPSPMMSAVIVRVSAVTLIGTVVNVPLPLSPPKPSVRSSATPRLALRCGLDPECLPLLPM